MRILNEEAVRSDIWRYIRLLYFIYFVAYVLSHFCYFWKNAKCLANSDFSALEQLVPTCTCKFLQSAILLPWSCIGQLSFDWCSETSFQLHCPLHLFYRDTQQLRYINPWIPMVFLFRYRKQNLLCHHCIPAPTYMPNVLEVLIPDHTSKIHTSCYTEDFDFRIPQFIFSLLSMFRGWQMTPSTLHHVVTKSWNDLQWPTMIYNDLLWSTLTYYDLHWPTMTTFPRSDKA